MLAFLIAIGLKPAFVQAHCTLPISYFSVFKNLSDDLSHASSFILLTQYVLICSLIVCFHGGIMADIDWDYGQVKSSIVYLCLTSVYIKTYLTYKTHIYIYDCHSKRIARDNKSYRFQVYTV